MICKAMHGHLTGAGPAGRALATTYHEVLARGGRHEPNCTRRYDPTTHLDADRIQRRPLCLVERHLRRRAIPGAALERRGLDLLPTDHLPADWGDRGGRVVSGPQPSR